MLKIAKAKDEKSFYKKFPTQEAFLKVHGKEFKKAQLANSIKNAQGGVSTDPGNDYYDNNYTGFETGYQQIPQSRQQLQPVSQLTPKGSTDNSIGGIKGFDTTTSATQGVKKSNIPIVGQITNTVTDISNAAQAFENERKQLRTAQQNKGVSDIQLQAVNSIDVGAQQQQEDTQHKRNLAFRQPISGNNLFPINGIGSNILNQNGGNFQGGGEIQNTYGNDYSLYDNGGYEPLNDSNIKNFRQGGEFNAQEGFDYGGLSNMATGMVGQAYDDNAGFQTGKVVGDVVNMIPGVGPIFGAIASPVLGAIGGGLDNAFGDAGKIKSTQSAVNRNIKGIQTAATSKSIHGQNQSYMKEGGSINDWNPQLITKFGDHSAKDIYDFAHEGMSSLRTGGNLRDYVPPSERAMETYAMGGLINPPNRITKDALSNTTIIPNTNPTINEDRFRYAVGTQGGVQHGINGEQGYYLYYGKKPGDSGFDPKINREFVNQSRYETYMNSPQGHQYRHDLSSNSTHPVEPFAIGGQLQMGGQLQTQWGGKAQPISHNPYMPGSGETIMFKGASHNNGGIGVNYGSQNGSQIEVEGGEPMYEMQDGGNIDPNTGQPSTTGIVLGNIRASNDVIKSTGDNQLMKLYDDYGGTFKSMGAKLAGQENKANSYMGKASTIANDADNTKWGSLNKSTANMIQKAGDSRLKEIAISKTKLANFQTAINDAADEHSSLLGKKVSAEAYGKGIVAIDKDPITKNNPVKAAKKGIKLVNGGPTDPPKPLTFNSEEEAIAAGYIKRPDGTWHNITKGTALPAVVSKTAIADTNVPAQHQNSTGLYGNITPEQFEVYKKRNDWYDWTGFDPHNHAQVVKYENAFNAKAKELGSNVSIGQQGKAGQQGMFGQQDYSANIDMNTNQKSNPDTDLTAIINSPNKRIDIVPNNQNKLWQYANIANQFIPKHQLPGLDPRQLTGEMYSLENNNLDPVQANFYHPNLTTPYDISLQDQLNANNSDYRSTQRMAGYNPSMMSNLNAQKYAANSKVLGDQFRMNQGEKAQVYGQNTNILNAAQEKNLGIADQQYVRQSQAISNTKAVNEHALTSIADKYIQNDERNLAYNVQSNMFPTFGYDSSGKIHTQGPGAQFNIPQMYGGKETIQELPVYKADGTTIDHYKMQPIDNSQNGNSINRRKSSIVKNAKNGSIVKMYKNF